MRSGIVPDKSQRVNVQVPFINFSFLNSRSWKIIATALCHSYTAKRILVSAVAVEFSFVSFFLR